MGEAAETLWRTAQALAPPGRLPPLFFVTDPARTPDPAAVAERLPRGAGVIYRAFGAPDAAVVADRLRRVASARGLTLLIGLDAALAEACRADGVHLPERSLEQGPQLRAAHPGWILTGATHGDPGLALAARAGLDGSLLSPVFESASPSAAGALGLDAFTALVRAARLPVYALGGVTALTAPALLGSGAAGLAAVDGVAEAFGGPAGHEKGR